MDKQLEYSLLSAYEIIRNDFITGDRQVYDDYTLFSSINIFMSALLSKMWELQNIEQMNIEDRSNMAVSLGNEIRKLIRTYTGIDSVVLANSLSNIQSKI